jgi:hypothetical protein
MIDFVKINNLSIGLKIQDKLDFELKVNRNTGEELLTKKTSANLKNMIFTITPEYRNENGILIKCNMRTVKVQGSLLKYSNGGGLNNNRFTFEQFCKVWHELNEYIATDDIINTIEFGCNIATPFNPSDLINNLIAHKKKQFNKTIKQGYELSQAEYDHCILKIYNKGLQQGPQGANILRVEAKYLKMQKLFPDGLKWSDLARMDVWLYLGNIVRKKFNEIVYYDPTIDLKKVPERDRTIIVRGHNPIYWEHLSGPHVSRTRSHYQSLINKYGRRFNILPELLDRELKEMVKSYQFSDQVNSTSILPEFNEMVKSYPLLYSNFSPPQQNASTNTVNCCVTGIDISMQKPGSKFLCISGIRWLFLTDQEGYRRLKSERLSKRWLNESLGVQFREICHSVRNEYFNARNNTQRAIKKITRDSVLFDIWPYIREDKRTLLQAN